MTYSDSEPLTTADFTLDGNAVAGMLQALWHEDMSRSSVICVNCDGEHAIGALQVFNQGPGIVLRCPGCSEVMLRIVQTPRATLLDARGVLYLQFPA